jgi:hypothetical protein
MNSRLTKRLVGLTMAGATMLPMIVTTQATAAVSAKCTAAQATKQQLRFNYKNGSIQICARAASGYKWRVATPTEAQRPYLGYLRPLPTSTYFDASPSLTGAFVKSFADLFRDQDASKLFAGFVAVGIKANASPNDYDSIAIIFPYSQLGRSVIGGSDPAELNDGATETLAGRPVSYESDGQIGSYTYVGQTAIVQFLGEPADKTYLPGIVTEWLNAHGAV